VTKTKASANFRTLLKSIGNDEVVVPLLRSALYDPSFKGFTIEVEGFEPRPPDGWFWPSTHPLWPERLLFQYATEPQGLVLEPMDPTGTLAVTAGSFFHTFTQVVLVREGVLERQPVLCGCGKEHPERAEVHLVDEEARTRGHSDGAVYDGSGFEFKTMNPSKMQGIPKASPTDAEVLEWFKTKCPDYYAQAQEYLRMSGRRRMIVVILALVYPFEMREIHVAYDRAYATATREKYLRVRQAIADQRPPRCECGPQTKDCPARLACWA
jgi:hypothetical protein